MRRLLAIFLLLFLPLQMSMAAVAMYCEHESGSKAAHLGHHEHEHEASDNTGSDDQTTKGAHLDCGPCHASCALPLCSPEQALNVSAMHLSASAVASAPSAPPPSRPERPKWFSLA